MRHQFMNGNEYCTVKLQSGIIYIIIEVGRQESQVSFIGPKVLKRS